MRYILMGSQPLEFPDLRVEPCLAGTPFEYELEPVRERLLIASGVIALASEPESDAPKARKGR